MNKFLTLLGKDWRVNRVPVVALEFGTIGAYALACIIYIWGLHLAQAKHYPNPFFPDVIQGGAMLALCFTTLVASAFGGNAFAGERRDRTADFMGTLPATRIVIILSKLTLAAACLLASWFLNGTVLYFALEGRLNFDADVKEILTVWITAEAAMFGISWMFSTFLESAAISAVIAMAVVLLSVVAVIYGFEHHGRNGPEPLLLYAGWWAAVITFAIGSVYYLRRVAP